MGKEKNAITIYKKEFLEKNHTVLAYASTPKHKHEFWEFVYWIKGKSKNVFKEHTFSTSPGLVLFIHPEDMHENTTISLSYIHRDLYLREEELQEICNIVQEGLFEELCQTQGPISFMINPNDIEFLETLMSKASIVGCEMDPRIKVTVAVALLGLYIGSKKTSQEVPPIVVEFVKLIEENVGRIKNKEIFPKVELRDLAASLNYDYAYLSRIFKKHIGISPQEYFIQKKMVIATLLLNENMSVSKISEILQYAADSHFVKAFKIYYGFTLHSGKRNNKTG